MAKRNRTIKKNQFAIPLLTNERSEVKATIMKQLYDACKFGRLCYIDAADPVTNSIVPMLGIVGDMETDKFDLSNVFPIAYFISSEEESMSYLVPDGAGNYVKRDEGGIFGTTAETVEARQADGQAAETADSAGALG